MSQKVREKFGSFGENAYLCTKKDNPMKKVLFMMLVAALSVLVTLAMPAQGADLRLDGPAMPATRFSLIDERPLLGDFVRNEALRPEAETLASACGNRLPQATACPAHLVGKRQGRPGERFLPLAAPYAGLLCVGGRYAAADGRYAVAAAPVGVGSVPCLLFPAAVDKTWPFLFGTGNASADVCCLSGACDDARCSEVNAKGREVGAKATQSQHEVGVKSTQRDVKSTRS